MKKWDSLGRRTDRVMRRERNRMVRLFEKEGFSVQEIADELDRVPWTVWRHLGISGVLGEPGNEPPELRAHRDRLLEVNHEIHGV